MALAKYARADEVESPAEAIAHVMNETLDGRVYGSSVYALSLLDDEEFATFLPSVIASLGRHETETAKDSVVSALSKHQDAFARGLLSADRAEVAAAIQACALIAFGRQALLRSDVETFLTEHERFVHFDGRFFRVLPGVQVHAAL